MRKLLITGSNGLIGGVLTTGLAHSFDIFGLDQGTVPSARSFVADISDYSEVANVFKGIESLELVVHLAANPSGDASWESVLHNNIIGTRNVYEAAKESNVRRVVFASSNHATGMYEGLPPKLHEQDNPTIITIQDPIRPDSDYGVSKAFGEAVARYYYDRWGIESVCLRIGTVRRDDDPTKNPRHRKTWLSHRDLTQLVDKSLSAKVEFGIYYGISNNKGRFWDISNSNEEIGYDPVDDASTR